MSALRTLFDLKPDNASALVVPNVDAEYTPTQENAQRSWRGLEQRDFGSWGIFPKIPEGAKPV